MEDHALNVRSSETRADHPPDRRGRAAARVWTALTGIATLGLSWRAWKGLARSLADCAHRYLSSPDHLCPLCGFEGRFEIYNGRVSARCPACGSIERHRLFALLHRRGAFDFRDRRVLHFAPEPPIARLIVADRPARYVTADLEPGRAELRIDLQDIGLPARSWDVAVCLHVLEHVPDDRRAMAELHRILAPGGVLVAMVPTVDTWHETFEDPSIRTPEERRRHFGQHDHLRRYATADFVRRLEAAGFRVERHTVAGRACGTHALLPGETLFLAVRD